MLLLSKQNPRKVRTRLLGMSVASLRAKEYRHFAAAVANMGEDILCMTTLAVCQLRLYATAFFFVY